MGINSPNFSSRRSINYPQRTSSPPCSDTVLAHPSWSSDGTKIVFSSDSSGNEEIWLIDAQGGNPVQLTSNDARDFDPEFSPDGNSIAFASDMDSPDFSEIYVMSASWRECHAPDRRCRKQLFARMVAGRDEDRFRQHARRGRRRHLRDGCRWAARLPADARR